MITIYYKETPDDPFIQIDAPRPGCWIHVSEASASDINQVSDLIGLEYTDIYDCLDRYEIPRIDIVGDLDEVIDHRAGANFGGSKAGSVDGGISADFDIILDDNDADLIEFFMLTALVGGKAEAAGANDDTGLQGDAIAKAASLADRDIAMEERVFADVDAGADRAERADAGMVANHNTCIDNGVRANNHPFSELSAFMNNCRGVDPFKGALWAVGAHQKFGNELEGA